jgi:hypothetical protein
VLFLGFSENEAICMNEKISAQQGTFAWAYLVALCAWILCASMHSHLANLNRSPYHIRVVQWYCDTVLGMKVQQYVFD